MLDGYMNANFGDDLLVSILARRFPETTFGIFQTDDYLTHLGHLGNVVALGKLYDNRRPVSIRLAEKARLILRRPRSALVSAVRSFAPDLYLWYGGSLFIETGSVTESGRNRELLWASRHVPHAGVLDASFGPYQTEKYRSELRNIFAGLDFVAFRDEDSSALFSELENVTCGADAVFLADCPSVLPERVRANGVLSVVPVDLRVRPGLERHFTGYMSALRAACVRWLSAPQRTVRLLAFCEAEHDTDAVDDLAQSLSVYGDRVSTERYVQVDQMVRLMTESELVIASRFHGVFLSIARGVPVIPISYGPKTDDMLRVLGYGDRILGVNCASVEPGDVILDRGMRIRGSELAARMMRPLEELITS